jgi:hypothetical protein
VHRIKSSNIPTFVQGVTGKLQLLLSAARAAQQHRASRHAWPRFAPPPLHPANWHAGSPPIRPMPRPAPPSRSPPPNSPRAPKTVHSPPSNVTEMSGPAKNSAPDREFPPHFHAIGTKFAQTTRDLRQWFATRAGVSSTSPVPVADGKLTREATNLFLTFTCWSQQQVARDSSSETVNGGCQTVPLPTAAF